MTAQQTSLLTLDDLGDRRQRVIDGVDWMEKAVGDPDQVDRDLARLKRVVSTYVDGLIAYHNAMGDDAIQQRLRTHAERLERGWLMDPTDRVTRDQIDEQFRRLLREYEALADIARKPRIAANAIAARIALIEQRARSGGAA